MFILLVLLLAIAGASCTVGDRDKFRKHGRTWPATFRSLGGLRVTTEAYKTAVMRVAQLTSECATCYADVYDCGYNNCWWSCSTAGPKCDSCLLSEGCIASLNKCTGF